MSQNVKNLEELKISIIENIDNQSSKAINIAKKILKNPEPGFREYKTSQIVKNEFKKIGLRYEADIALTGVKAKLTTNKPGPSIAVIGEFILIQLLSSGASRWSRISNLNMISKNFKLRRGAVPRIFDTIPVC